LGKHLENSNRYSSWNVVFSFSEYKIIRKLQTANSFNYTADVLEILVISIFRVKWLPIGHCWHLKKSTGPRLEESASSHFSLKRETAKISKISAIQLISTGHYHPH